MRFKATHMSAVLLMSLALGLWGCGPVGASNETGNTNDNTNVNTNQNQNNVYPDASVEDLVRFQGVVWSPGADQAATLASNRFPIPGAAVIAYSSSPSALPQEMYCNECVEIVDGTPNVIGNPVDGSFELLLLPGHTYYLAVQKGEFRRVRQLVVPDTPGEIFTLEGDPSGPKPEQTTLPNHTDAALGDNIPRVAILEGAWEDQQDMWETLGFDYAGEVVLVPYSGVTALINDYNELSKYNLVVFPCGADMPYEQIAVDNLRQYVREGGKLYIDDFSYDFAEQVWPEFLSFYVREDDFGDIDFVCGDGASTAIGACNDWYGAYNFTGTPGDANFGDWISQPEVNGTAPISLQEAWNSIHLLGEGEIGIDPECMGNCGPNGEVYALPKVWMYGDTPAAGAENPATVSWPYYCGKVLFTVYHTHENSTGEGTAYPLTLQEKIMMYLIMEIQTCSIGPVVN